MMPRVLAVRSAFPEHRLAQAEITHAFASRGRLGPAERALTERLHGSAEVDTRHIVLPVDECVELQSAPRRSTTATSPRRRCSASGRCGSRSTPRGCRPPTSTC